MPSLSRYTKKAILGGIISLVVIAVGVFILGRSSGYEAKILIQKSLKG
jgi:hypothetical protein|nr:hypothetical protein [Allomuricauda sp.]